MSTISKQRSLEPNNYILSSVSGLNGGSQGNHRRTISNAANDKFSLAYHRFNGRSKEEASEMKSLGRNSRLIGSPAGKEGFKDNQPIEIDTYVAKRLRAISELQNSLNTNIDKFSQLVSDCYKDYYKRKPTSSSLAMKEAGRLFQELSVAFTSQRNASLDERSRLD